MIQGVNTGVFTCDAMDFARRISWDTKLVDLVLNGRDLITNWIPLASQTTRTPNAILAPDGTSYATLFKRTSIFNPSAGAQLRQLTPPIEANTDYSYCFWAKRVSLTVKIVLDICDTPNVEAILNDHWTFYFGTLRTLPSFPVGKFFDIGSGSPGNGSVLNEEYSIWDLKIVEGTNFLPYKP